MQHLHHPQSALRPDKPKHEHCSSHLVIKRGSFANGSAPLTGHSFNILPRPPPPSKDIDDHSQDDHRCHSTHDLYAGQTSQKHVLKPTFQLRSVPELQCKDMLGVPRCRSTKQKRHRCSNFLKQDTRAACLCLTLHGGNTS